MALGLIVIFGWHLGRPEIVQIFPYFAPMQHNTALAFLLCGGGLVAASYDHRLITGLCGGGAAVLGLLAIVEDLYGVELGIDEFFFHGYRLIELVEHEHTFYPGHMALNTALAFTLSGSALLSFGLKSWTRRNTLATGTLASLVLGLGLAAFIGYLARLDAAHGWGDFAHMAIHTAAGFIILGVGLIAFTLHKARTLGSRLPWLLPFAVVMPDGMSGTALARKAQQIQPGLKIVMATGYNPDDLELKEGNWPLLLKPCRKAELAMCVRQALDGEA